MCNPRLLFYPTTKIKVDKLFIICCKSSQIGIAVPEINRNRQKDVQLFGYDFIYLYRYHTPAKSENIVGALSDIKIHITHHKEQSTTVNLTYHRPSMEYHRMVYTTRYPHTILSRQVSYDIFAQRLIQN